MTKNSSIPAWWWILRNLLAYVLLERAAVLYKNSIPGSALKKLVVLVIIRSLFRHII